MSRGADPSVAAARRPLWRKLLLAGLSLVLVALMLRWFEHQQVYFPSRSLDWTPATAGWTFEDVRLETADGVTLHAWFLPAPARADGPGWTVLLFHGNGGNISHRFDLYALFRELGLDVLAVDYRGYGRSEGAPSESGTYLDAEAAWQWLADRGVPGERMLAYGESLGGAVATELALRRKVGGLILQSTFTSVPDVGAELFPWLPVRWLMSIRYDTRAKLPRVRCPVLILHSRADTLIRFRHAERNYAAAREPKLLWEIAGDHNEALLSEEGRRRWREGMRKFLETLPAKAGSATPESTEKRGAGSR